MSNETRPAAARPLSPHLQIYRWEITMFLSILHRATGAALAVGALVFTCWLMAVMQGPAAYADFAGWARTPVGLLAALGWLFALSFHFLNGIRHLVWDTGTGVHTAAARRSGWLVLALSVVATAALWMYARHALGL